MFLLLREQDPAASRLAGFKPLAVQALGRGSNRNSIASLVCSQCLPSACVFLYWFKKKCVYIYIYIYRMYVHMCPINQNKIKNTLHTLLFFGWYTFQESIMAIGTALVMEMFIRKSVINSETLSVMLKLSENIPLCVLPAVRSHADTCVISLQIHRYIYSVSMCVYIYICTRTCLYIQDTAVQK